MEKDTLIRQHVLRSTISNYGAKVIMLGTWFLLTPFILHQLGPDGYGLWVVVGSATAYGTLLNFGISGAVIKYVAEHRANGESQQAASLVATALCLYSVLGLIATAISLAIAPLFPLVFNVLPEQQSTAISLVRLMGLGVGISIPCATATAVLWGLQRFDTSNFLNVAGTMLTAAGIVAVLLLGGGVLGMVAVSILVTLLMQVPTVWVINRLAPDLRFGWRGANPALARTVMSFSWPLFVIDAGDRLQNKTDEIVISAFLPISAVAPYAIARKLSEVAQILTDQFMRVLLPLASRLNAENDQARIRSMYLIGTRLTLVILLPVGCSLIVLAPPILTLWVGADYADYAYLVTILTVASLIDTSQWPAGSILQGVARHRPLALISFGAGIANVALSMALVQSLGLTGVAVGTLVPTIVASLGLMLPYSMRTIGVDKAQLMRQVFLPAWLPVIPMGIVLHVGSLLIQPASLFSIVVLAGMGLSVYAASYLAFGASDAERQTCRGALVNALNLVRSCFNRT